MPTKVRARDEQLWRQQGFTLPELIVAVLILSGFLLVSVSAVTAGKRLLPGREVQIRNERLPLAPSPAAFADAVALNAELMAHIARSRAVYVFGGAHVGLPVGASRVNQGPLSVAALPSLEIRTDETLPLDAQQFYTAHRSSLGHTETNPEAGDFSVLVLGPEERRLVVTALLQVRQSVILPDGAADRLTRCEATLYTRQHTYRYAFAEHADTRSVSRVGARHHWFRYEEGRVAEEGPALVIVPDPFLNAGSDETIPPFSRFVYFLPLSP